VPAETHVEQGPLDRNAIFEIVRTHWSTSGADGPWYRRMSTWTVPWPRTGVASTFHDQHDGHMGLGG